MAPPSLIFCNVPEPLFLLHLISRQVQGSSFLEPAVD